MHSASSGTSTSDLSFIFLVARYNLSADSISSERLPPFLERYSSHSRSKSSEIYIPVLTFSLIVIIPFLIIVGTLEVDNTVDVCYLIDTHSSEVVDRFVVNIIYCRDSI